MVEPALPPLSRRVFCNRTLNLRALPAVGCDMDYTLVHYDTLRWERRAYEVACQLLLRRKWPVERLRFDPELVSLGLIVDNDLGNLVKANRFGHVRNACHGTRMLGFEEWRSIYTAAPVDPSDSRWSFMSTLFSLSEACLYIQLVDLLDQGKLEPGLSYRTLHGRIRQVMDAAHLEGELKSEIMADPTRYVVLDADLAPTLLDLKHAGKKLLLITNSEWNYTHRMMSYALDRYLGGGSWRQLFDIIVVQARKPAFFSEKAPAFRLADERGLYEPHLGPLKPGDVYLGGHARLVESSLGLSADDILYIGDHIFADVHVSKDLLRWRTALVVRELERELDEVEAFRESQELLDEGMRRKEILEYEYSQLRLALQRSREGQKNLSAAREEDVKRRLRQLRESLVELDARLAPLAKASGELLNRRWGLLMRSGNDKSHLAQNIERYADIYMSRVSNLLAYTPFVYLRASRGSLPHDPL